MKLCHFPSALCTSTHESQKMVLCSLTSYFVVCPSLSHLPISGCVYTPTKATTWCLAVGVWWWLGYAFFLQPCAVNIVDIHVGATHTYTHPSHTIVFIRWSLVVVGLCLFCSHVQSTLLTYMWVPHTYTHPSHTMVFISWSLVVVGLCLFYSHAQPNIVDISV